METFGDYPLAVDSLATTTAADVSYPWNASKTLKGLRGTETLSVSWIVHDSVELHIKRLISPQMRVSVRGPVWNTGESLRSPSLVTVARKVALGEWVVTLENNVLTQTVWLRLSVDQSQCLSSTRRLMFRDRLTLPRFTRRFRKVYVYLDA